KNPAHYRLAFAQILGESHFPEDIQELLLEKLIARRNHMVQLFDLTRELEQEGYIAKHDFHPKKSVPPHVIKGEATLRSHPGYAGNYTVGDPESPLRWSEIRHFVKMELISQALGVATS